MYFDTNSFLRLRASALSLSSCAQSLLPSSLMSLVSGLLSASVNHAFNIIHKIRRVLLHILCCCHVSHSHYLSLILFSFFTAFVYHYFGSIITHSILPAFGWLVNNRVPQHIVTYNYHNLMPTSQALHDAVAGRVVVMRS